MGELAKKYKVTRSYISSLFKRRNVKKDCIAMWWVDGGKVVNIDSLEDNISGVYYLYFIINPNEYRAYIGSSVNIKSRLKSHLRDLNNNNHESASLLKYYKEFSINMAIVEECDREIVLQRESFYLGRFS